MSEVVQLNSQATSVSSLPSPRGAVWRRVDLHLHSPGVHTFKLPDGASPNTPEGKLRIVDAYVAALVTSRIEVAAITDYNGIREEWFSPLRSAAREQGVALLPGAEISFKAGKYGLHVLAVFGEDTAPSQVNAALQALDRDPRSPLLEADGRHRDIDPQSAIPDSLRKLRESFGCLLILPHPAEDNGLLRTFQPGDAADFLLDITPDAMDHCPDREVHKLRSTGKVDARFFDQLAWVEFSDPKGIEEIGTKVLADGSPRATYLKLSALDLDALYLALHDPQTRVARGRIPPATQPRIRRMVVTGSGFLGNLSLEWSEDLNVVIGGRGAGKSAILETLRYALDISPYTDHSHRHELVKHALGSGGRVEVHLERPVGNEQLRCYTVRRVWGEQPQVAEADAARPLELPPSELLGPEGGPTTFGQREIYAVSGSAEYRLSLLDELIGEEARRRADSVRRALERLAANGRAIMALQGQLAKREATRERLRAVEHELKVYEEHGAAAKLKEASQLRSDGQHLRGAVTALAQGHDHWQRLGDDVKAPLAAAGRNLSRGESCHKEILGEARRVIDDLHAELGRLLEEGEALFDQAATSIEALNARWREALQPLEEEINRIKQEAQSDRLDPDRLLRLTEEQAALVPLIEDLERTSERLEELRRHRLELLREVRELRHQEHQLRRERAEGISDTLAGRVKVRVEFKGQKEEYKVQLVSLLQGSGVSKDAVDNLASPEATDGLALASAVRKGAAEVQEKFGITAAMSARLVNWLTEEEARLFELETLIPADAVDLCLRVDDQYRSLGQLSTGQRATAVLLLLFALEGRILVLDQPEDDLDNRFVYEDVVQLLREQKGLGDSGRRRQIIMASHNANIPVLGDAELVVALEAREGRGRIVGLASIDDREVRGLIKNLMEGGEEAFRRRSEKYGGVRRGA